MSVKITFEKNVFGYEKFLKVRQCPIYEFRGSEAIVPDEFASLLGVQLQNNGMEYKPFNGLFDYQKDISETAIKKKKYAVFADCGLGKTLILLEFANHAFHATGKRILIVSPIMVVDQTISEAKSFYGEYPIQKVKASELNKWISTGHGIGITNFEAIREETISGDLGGLIIDESSMLKSHYGAWGTRLIEMGRGVEFKLCLTGTPAPNDRVEFANHAVFLDRAKTVNEFLATYFVNRGQTQNRWEIKPHALRPFSTDHWQRGRYF